MRNVAVLYSSGTTGKPKALVHTVGGMVLSSSTFFLLRFDLCAHAPRVPEMSNTVHNGFVANDCFLQFSTLGWMMWNVRRFPLFLYA